MARAALLALALALLGAAKAPAPELFIDPGHGGDEPGTALEGMSEAEAVLEIAQALRGLLKEKGVAAALSREDGASNPPPSLRAAAANASGAKAVISLHVNFSPSLGVRGARVFVPKEAPAAAGEKDAPVRWERAAAQGSAEARRLGGELAKALTTSESQKVQVQALNMALFRGLKLPAVVVELGYASHAETLALFKEPGFRADLAERLAQAWLAYSPPPAQPAGQP